MYNKYFLNNLLDWCVHVRVRVGVRVDSFEYTWVLSVYFCVFLCVRL